MEHAKESLRLHGEWKGKIDLVAVITDGSAVAKAVAEAAGQSGVARI